MCFRLANTLFPCCHLFNDVVVLLSFVQIFDGPFENNHHSSIYVKLSAAKV